MEDFVGLIGWLFIVLIGVLVNASRKGKQGAQKPTGRAGQPTQQSAPVRAPQPPKRTLSQDEIKKAVEVLLKQQPAAQVKPAPAQPSIPPEPVKPPEDSGFYQGTSFGDEGVDPCHDEMFENRPLSPEHSAEPQPAFQLRFSADSVLNGVIMSEVLNRRA